MDEEKKKKPKKKINTLKREQELKEIEALMCESRGVDFTQCQGRN